MLFYRMYKKIKSVLFYIKLLYNSTKYYYSTGRLKNGITTLKLIQNAKIEEEITEKMRPKVGNHPLKNRQNPHFFACCLFMTCIGHKTCSMCC